MKKKLRLLVLAILSATLAPAQVTITNSSFPNAGDTLLTAVDNLPAGNYITDSGPAQSWDFTTLQSPFPRRTLLLPAMQGPGSYAFPNASYHAGLANNLTAYYRVSNSKVELLGFFGVDPLGLGLEAPYRYDPPVVQQRAPLNYLDMNESQSNLSLPFSADDLPAGVLDNLPITPDSLRIRLNIQRSDVADAWGTLTIPGGIYDVLREKRTEVRETRLDAKISIFGWQDITDIAIQALGLPQLGALTTVSYYYFSNEAVEPIALVVANEDESQVLRVEYKANNITTNVQSADALKPGVWAFPNPAIVNVRFEFTNLPAGRYKLKIHNILGVEEWRKSYYINGSHTEKVDISALRKGTYLYSLVDEQGKAITTRRLIVVRP
ncbi:MAG: T9SS type A sorting domain-containing protein [Phaeodactylibacter sp.]|nr:T9SS type A sorting domain-containing protein [Phaeodactylibacter sp.]